MKKQKLFAGGMAGVGAFMIATCATTSGASALEPNIYVDGGFSSSDNIYVASGCKSNTEQTVEYCANTNTLTFDNYDGDSIDINYLNNINIKFKGDNKFRPQMHAPEQSYSGSIFDFGGAKAKITSDAQSKVSLTAPEVAADSSFVVFRGVSALTIQGGDYNIDASFFANREGHIITDYSLAAEYGPVIIDSANIVASNAGLMLSMIEDQPLSIKNSFIISDGAIDAYGGIVIVDSDVSATRISADKKDFSIDGDSLLNIDITSEDSGIGITAGKTSFLNGTTTITTKKHAYISTALEGLILGDDMCLGGPAYLDEINNRIFVKPSNEDIVQTITIKSGTCANPDIDDEDIDIEEGVKVPNTGDSAEDGGFAKFIPFLLAPIAIILTAIITNTKKHYSNRVKFTKH